MLRVILKAQRINIYRTILCALAFVFEKFDDLFGTERLRSLMTSPFAGLPLRV